MNKLLPIATITTSLLIATAYAAQPSVTINGLAEGDVLGKSEVEIVTALEALGAAIGEVETEDGEIEVEFTLDGKEYEVEIDAATGLIAELELEDDDDQDSDYSDKNDDND